MRSFSQHILNMAGRRAYRGVFIVVGLVVETLQQARHLRIVAVLIAIVTLQQESPRTAGAAHMRRAPIAACRERSYMKCVQRSGGARIDAATVRLSRDMPCW